MKNPCAKRNNSTVQGIRRTINGIAVIVLLLLAGCYENQEGCLDLQATNFDLDADIDCEGCCVYPKLEVSFLHRIKDNSRDTFYNFALNTPYSFSVGDTFLMENIRFYLSDFQLKLEDGSLLGVEDRLEIAVPMAMDTVVQEVEDNFALVNRSRPSTSTLGTLRKEVVCTGIQFKLGIKDSVNRANPTFFEATHPLFSDLDGDLYFSPDSGYVFNRLELFRNTTDTLASSILMGTSDFLQTIDLNYPFSTKKGFNTTLILRVDYREWLKDIDFVNDNTATMATKIKAGIGNSFELVEVRN